MKTDKNDMIEMLSDIDEELIEEANPYSTDSANNAAGVGIEKGAGTTSRGMKLRVLTRIAAAAAVLLIGFALIKFGVPMMKPGSGDKPGANTAATPTMEPVDTPTPTMALRDTPTPTMALRDTPTPTMEPAYTPTPTPEPAYTPTPTMGFPVFTPTPTMGQRPTPTPDPDAGEPLPYPAWNSLTSGEHRLLFPKVQAREYFKYLSPDLLAEYTFNSASSRDVDYDRYDALWFIKKDEDGYRNYLGIIVRMKEDTQNYEERLVSAADVEVYDVAGREDPFTVVGEDFYTAEVSPIFQPEEFTDEVLAHRVVYHDEDGEQYEQIWFAIDRGDYVFHYIFHGRSADLSASMIVSDGLLDEETIRNIDDRQYMGVPTQGEDPSEQ